MPANTGTPPRHERCDIKFRNGQVRRSVDPKQWRWKLWDWGSSEFDITEWQPSK
jgi:hypothetical protein